MCRVDIPSGGSRVWQVVLEINSESREYTKTSLTGRGGVTEGTGQDQRESEQVVAPRVECPRHSNCKGDGISEA